MEDEQGGFCPVRGEGVSELPVNVTLPDETHVENIGEENQIESYEEGGGGEIMVEVLGSDVFVDGVSSSNKEVDFMSAAIGGLGSDILLGREEIKTQNFTDATALLSNGDENKLVESKLELSVSGNEHKDIVPKEAEGKFFESFAVCVMSSREAKSGIEAMAMASSSTTQSVAEQTEEVVEKISVVVREETEIEDETACNSNASVNDGAPELLTDHVESSLVGNFLMITKEGAIKVEGVDGNSAYYEAAEHLSDPVEDLVVEDASHDVMSLEDTATEASGQIAPTEALVNPSSDCLDYAIVDEVDGVFGEFGSVKANKISHVDHNSDTVARTCDGEEIVTTGGTGDGVSGPNSVSESPTGDCGINEKIVIDPESEDLIQKPGGQLFDIKHENQGCVDEVPCTKCEETGGVDNASHVQTLVSEREEAMEVDLDDLDFKDEKYDVATSNDEIDESRESEENSSKSCDDHVVEGHTSEARLTDVEEEAELDQEYHQGEEVDDAEPDSGNDESASQTGKKKLSKKGRVKSSSVVRMSQPGYLSAPEKESGYEVSDLVWGKVKSHPWWPGQIFDPEDASDKAVKHSKKDSYLVAYFGDRTFAWNDASFLKPLRSQFSQIENQSTSETFQNAVSCALEEVSRRVELGLSCSCIPKDAYSEIATQIVDNAGIREESSRRNGVDQSCRATYFEPDGLLQFVRDLASRVSCGADRLDFAIVQAQLSAFCHFKGYRLPTGFPLAGALLENDAETEQLSDKIVYSRKSKWVPKDNLQSWTKEKISTELPDDVSYSPDGEDDESIAKDVSFTSGKKRKASDPLSDGSDKRTNVNSGKTLASTNQTPKPSFKIGECIRRVASQLTGSTLMVKTPTDEVVTNGSLKIYDHAGRQTVVVSAESSSLVEMLSQLQLVAQDPNKQHEFRDEIITFFSGFRSSVVNKRVRKKKADKSIGMSAEDFEFDDVSDSYWTDRIVQNYSEKQLLLSNENGEGNLQPTPVDVEKSLKSGGKSNSRKRFYYTISGSCRNVSEESGEKVKRVKQESAEKVYRAKQECAEKVNRVKQETSPAELILNFAERKSIPSEINLNKTFRRFGSLMESETEVDHEAGRARVIFKRGSDAEVAHNSAQKFNIFGSVLVSYEIGYSPLISVKILPVTLLQFQEDATLMQ